jgi:hypothetical protein
MNDENEEKKIETPAWIAPQVAPVSEAPKVKRTRRTKAQMAEAKASGENVRTGRVILPPRELCAPHTLNEYGVPMREVAPDCIVRDVQHHRISLLFRPLNAFIGVYADRKCRQITINILPCIGIVVYY